MLVPRSEGAVLLLKTRHGRVVQRRRREHHIVQLLLRIGDTDWSCVHGIRVGEASWARDYTGHLNSSVESTRRPLAIRLVRPNIASPAVGRIRRPLSNIFALLGVIGLRALLLGTATIGERRICGLVRLTLPLGAICGDAGAACLLQADKIGGREASAVRVRPIARLAQVVDLQWAERTGLQCLAIDRTRSVC